ncbi:MAG: hypothetical protein OEV87_02160 [Phycisphaerae bacterium]|nr:hypothetical protein [Phycisphaerae bacterium]
MQQSNITLRILFICLISLVILSGFTFYNGVLSKLDEDMRQRSISILVRLTAFFVVETAFILFLIHNKTLKGNLPSGKQTALILALIILNGTLIRLFLAYYCFGNYDMHSYQLVSDIVSKGGNVYAETDRYNYSPVWFTLLGVFSKIHGHLSILPFHFIVKSLITGIDLLTLTFLLLIARIEGASLIKISVFYYLNPISFLLTGYHGQFENLAVLMVVIGIFCYLKLKNNPPGGKTLLWIFMTLGLIIKHNVFYELIIGLHAAFKRCSIKILLLSVSLILFLSLFIPYWETGKTGILQNVFGYSGMNEVNYGMAYIAYHWFPQLKYMFIAGMCIFPFLLKREDIISRCLLGFLFFVTFCTGMSIQYFVLPIALGSLRPTKGFLLYSLVGSLVILGNENNLNIPLFNVFFLNTLWIGAIYWFSLELWKKI